MKFIKKKKEKEKNERLLVKLVDTQTTDQI